MASSRASAIAAALVPPLLVAFAGGAARSAAQARALTLGITLGADHSGGAPLAQLLAPIGTLVPFGDLDLRAELALSLPAAVAAALITRRAARHPSGATGLAPHALVLAIGVVAGALLASCEASTSMTVIAAEISIGALFAAANRRVEALAIAFATSALALWCAPRNALPIVVVVALTARATGRVALARAAWRSAAIFAPIAVAALLFDGIRSARGWLVLGRLLVDGAFARATEAWLPTASAWRIGVAAAVLATIALVSAASARKLGDDDRVAALTALAFGLDAWVLHPPGGAIPAVVVLLPTAGATLGAMHIAIDRSVGARIAPSWRALAWIVPALALGGASRGVEDELRARYLGGDAAAAPAMAALATIGTSPPRAVLIVEDEPTLVRFAHDQALLALRADLRVLPTYTLLFGGPSAMARRTITALPAAGEVVRALLASATLEESDVAPLAQQVPVIAALGVPRLKAVARHVDSTGGAVMIAIERVDPSDRRVRRIPIDRRLAFVVGALAGLPTSDPTRAALRTAALREARLLSLAVDREGASAAIARALALGADAERMARWTAKVKAKQSLEGEPKMDDE